MCWLARNTPTMTNACNCIAPLLPPLPRLQPGTQVVVHGLPYSYTWQQLKDLGKAAASVVHADVVANPDGSSKGWGILAFATPSDAQAAIQVGWRGVPVGRSGSS